MVDFSDNSAVPRSPGSFGSLSWGQRDGRLGQGRMTLLEKVRLVLGLAAIWEYEQVDGLLYRFGFLKPTHADLEVLMPPESALTRDSLAFASRTQAPALLHHSWRTYLFAAALGDYRGLPVDREILFSAAILHDTGLVDESTPPMSRCCFAVSGAQQAQAELRRCGHADEKTSEISDAIALHLNGYVSRRKHGAVAHLVSRGAMCDVFGFGHRRITLSTIKRILEKHPRVDLFKALQIEGGKHLPETRPDFLSKLGKGAPPRTAFDSLPFGRPF